MTLKNKIWVVGGQSYGSVLTHLGEVTYKAPSTMEEFKSLSLIMFTGGEDVHPDFYNGVHKGVSFCNKERDEREKHVFDLALKYGIKMTGICRGFQFLNVMCGGKMYQHITGHTGRNHSITIPKLNKEVYVTSTHHQLVKPDWSVALPVAWSSVSHSDIYVGPNCEKAPAPDKEIESLVFPEFNAFGVQFHPEMMGSSELGRKLYTTLMDTFLNESMDLFIERYVYNAMEKKSNGYGGT